MSKLEKRKRRAIFETLSPIFSRGQTRPVMLELHPTYMKLRLKGTRKIYSANYAAIFHWALLAQVLADRRARAEARKKKST